MAGDWIKMRIDLQTHPKVVRILSAMRPHDVRTVTDKFRVVGGLHAVWGVFDTHSTDGTLQGYTPEMLDHVIGLEGFASAMISVGWLEFDGAQTLVLPEFDEHNGKSGKRRAEDQKRKRNSRNCPQSVRNLSGDDADENRTREEKRREEKELLSGKPEVLDVLQYLNTKAGRDYRPVDSNLKLISARLAEGATVAECKQVIDAKVKKWASDEKMAEYLRPATLFNATNFAQYVGELGALKVATSGGVVDPRFKGAK